MKRHTLTGTLIGLTVIHAFLLVPDSKAEEDEPFQFGGSCAALAYTTTSQLGAMLAATYADDLSSFCVPEEPFDCAEYSSLLKGRGRLVTGEDGYHCTLQLTR
jgi:hypothetical protein